MDILCPSPWSPWYSALQGAAESVHSVRVLQGAASVHSVPITAEQCDRTLGCLFADAGIEREASDQGMQATNCKARRRCGRWPLLCAIPVMATISFLMDQPMAARARGLRSTLRRIVGGLKPLAAHRKLVAVRLSLDKRLQAGGRKAEDVTVMEAARILPT